MRSTLAATLLLLPVLALAGCGDGTAEPAAPPVATVQPGSPTGPAAPAPSGSQPAVTPPGPSGGPTAPVVTPTSPSKKQVKEFAACMRKHGVNVPDDAQNWTPPPGYDPSKAQQAVVACMKYIVPSS